MTSSEYLAQTLRRLQAERHMTCAEFADFLGINKSTLYKLLTGYGPFSSATLDQIAERLNLPPAELLGGEVPVRRICESVVSTSAAAGKLGSVEHGKGLHHLGALMELFAYNLIH